MVFLIRLMLWLETPGENWFLQDRKEEQIFKHLKILGVVSKIHFLWHNWTINFYNKNHQIGMSVTGYRDISLIQLRIFQLVIGWFFSWKKSGLLFERREFIILWIGWQKNDIVTVRVVSISSQTSKASHPKFLQADPKSFDFLKKLLWIFILNFLGGLFSDFFSSSNHGGGNLQRN
jgi:hypothetical protein